MYTVLQASIEVAKQE